MSLADCCTQTVDCCLLHAFRYSILATFSFLGRCRSLDICFKLLAYYLSNYLPASHTFFFNARSSLKEICCIPIAYRFSVRSSCFALITAYCRVLLSGSLPLPTFTFLIIRSVLFTRYSFLVAYGLSSVFSESSCCFLLNVRCLIVASCIWLLAKRW